MADTFQNEVPGRALISNYLFIPAARKRRSNCRSNCLPLAILVMVRKTGLYRKEKKSTSIKITLTAYFRNLARKLTSVPNTLAGNGEEENVRLRFTDIKDFEPEQVARQIPQLRAMLAMRNLLRDLKSNLLDNATFRKELEAILKDPALSQELRDEMSALAPK